MANIINVSVGGQTVPVKTIGGQSVRPSAAGGSTHVSPGAIAVIGKSPYINSETGTWMIYDDESKAYVDSGVVAEAQITGASDEFIIDDNGILFINEIEISKIDGLAAMLDESIRGVSADGILLPITDQIVDIPIATAEELGLVRSSNSENMIVVDGNGYMEVSNLNVNRLVQTDGERFTLNAGNSTD